MSKKNLKLRKQCINLNITMKELAKEMELSETQFNRKLNNRRIKNSFASFNKCEKYYLANRLNMNIEDIE